MIEYLILLAGMAGAFILGWDAHAWYCRRMNPQCPIWQAERDSAWKAELRRRYPGTRPERRGTTEIATPGVVAESLDEQRKMGVPSERVDTPSTGVANKNRRTDR
jgi:predicted restriction endonuclease